MPHPSGAAPLNPYVAELRKIAENCKFVEKLEEHFKDRLVCRVRDENLQRRLLSEPDLTCKTAFKTALAVEATKISQ